MPSIKARQVAYAIAMNRYTVALQALDGPGPVNPTHREEAIDAQRDLVAVGEELISAEIQTVDDALEAVAALDFSLRTLEMFPSTAHHIAVKLAHAVNRLALDASARRQQCTAEGAR